MSTKTSAILMNPKGWIEVIWGPIIDHEVYISVAQQMLTLVTAMEDQRQDPFMLIDFSQLERITPDAATLAASATRDLGCKKLQGLVSNNNLRQYWIL